VRSFSPWHTHPDVSDRPLRWRLQPPRRRYPSNILLGRPLVLPLSPCRYPCRYTGCYRCTSMGQFRYENDFQCFGTPNCLDSPHKLLPVGFPSRPRIRNSCSYCSRLRCSLTSGAPVALLHRRYAARTAVDRPHRRLPLALQGQGTEVTRAAASTAAARMSPAQRPVVRPTAGTAALARH
jgi:hypothetical protein